MPAIAGQDHVHLLQARDWQQTVGQSGMTPTAFSFLIPVFVVAVVAPFAIVYCVRKRRRLVTPVTTRATPKVKKPALRRPEAREKLKEITQISTPVNYVTQDQETPESGSRSVLERECAICLSALYGPSLPEPAKLSPTSSISNDTPAAIPSSLPATADQTESTEKVTTAAPPVATQPEPETILKLIVCGHEFHAECLVSWFVLRKTSCPICRSMYMSTEEMQKYDEEEQIALGGTPIVTPTTSADPEAQVASSSPPQQQQEHPVEERNWRNFLHGRNPFRLGRRQAETQAQAQNDVELQDQSAAVGGQLEQQAASGDAAANQTQSSRSRWQRFFSRD